MKKIIIFGLVCFIWLSWVFADTNIIKKASIFKLKIYKEAILSRASIRNEVNNWEKIIDEIEIAFNVIRKNKDIKKLETLKTKSANILKKYDNKKYITTKEKKELYIVKNIFYRSYIELVNFWKIKI